jgi:broad specificity phosphatase PhoE
MTGDLVVIRHADTEWTVSGRHTGRTDIPLTVAGREKAAALAPRLAGRPFAAVWSSPLARARETARLAGFAAAAIHDELAEWDYGDYEGLTTVQIVERRPGWDLWRDGCPGGEDAAAVGARVDALLARLPAEGDVLAFSHGHLLRTLTARRLGLPPAAGALFLLTPGGVATLSHEHGRPVLSHLS